MPNTITPKLWQNGLFSAATEVDASEVNWDGRGWKLYTACPTGGLWCCEDSTADPAVPKTNPTPGEAISFKPFTVYQIASCAAGDSRLPVNMNNLDRLASGWLSANVEGWLSAGLEIGACESPGLIDLTDVTPVTAPSVSEAISLLIQSRLDDGLFDRPTIHLPAAAASYITEYETLLRIADVAVGPGYGTIAPTNAIDGGGWAYITGPVEYALGVRVEASPDSLTEKRRNYDDALAEQLAAYRFDPCGGYRTSFVYGSGSSSGGGDGGFDGGTP